MKMIRGFEYEKAYRQGEVLFFKLKPGTKPNHYGRQTEVPSGVIRVGEKEGHEHKLVGKHVQLSMFPDTTTTLTGEKDQPSEGILKVGEEGAKVVHPEHKPLKLPKGEYVVKTQKEATGRNSSASVRD
jgi:hypothetical protein